MHKEESVPVLNILNGPFEIKYDKETQEPFAIRSQLDYIPPALVLPQAVILICPHQLLHAQDHTKSLHYPSISVLRLLYKFVLTESLIFFFHDCECKYCDI